MAPGPQKANDLNADGTSIKAVIFDLGGVLYNFKDYKRFADFVAKARLNEQLRDQLIGWELGKYTTEDIIDAASEAFGEFPRETTALENLDFDEFMGGKVTESWDAIHRLKAAGFKVALLTNNGWLTGKRERTTICEDLECFDVVVESCRVGLRKPEPAIFQICLDGIGLKAQECVFIDDLPHNVSGAQEFGLHAIQLDNAKPAIAIQRLNEILPIKIF